MSTYHKINTIYKRDMAGDKKLIPGQWSLPEFEYLKDNEWEWTEKVDGTNIRIIFDRIDDYTIVKFAGRTDAANIPVKLQEFLTEKFGQYYSPRTRDNSLLSTIFSMMLERGIENIVLYGEGYGPKIQAGGGRYRKDPSFVLFDVKIGNFWLERKNVEDIASRLGLDIVPVVGYGSLIDAEQVVRAGLKSQWGDFEAEGIVARPAYPLFNRLGDRIIAKIKSRDFN